MNRLFGIFWPYKVKADDLLSSQLFSQCGFYQRFTRDLRQSTREVIIESPFLTSRRVTMLLPELRGLRQRGVRLVINTRPPAEHESYLRSEAESALVMLFGVNAEVYFTGGHHRKLALLDRQVLWEGSLNILSQNDSCEVMRRTESAKLAKQMLQFLDLP